MYVLIWQNQRHIYILSYSKSMAKLTFLRIEYRMFPILSLGCYNRSIFSFYVDQLLGFGTRFCVIILPAEAQTLDMN